MQRRRPGLLLAAAASCFHAGAGRFFAEAGNSNIQQSCAAKVESLLASPDLSLFAGEVRAANLERVAMLHALMEDPQLEVVLEEQLSQSGVFDFNEELDSLRAKCTAVQFNQSSTTNKGNKLCLADVLVWPANVTFTALPLTVRDDGVI